MTDAVSLSRFIIHSAENKVTGKYNVAYNPIPFKEYISALAEITNTPRKLHWIPGEFLLEQGVVPYKEIEYWKVRSPGSYYFSVDKAMKSGLKSRPIADMLKDQIRGYKRRFPKDDFEFGGIYEGDVVKLSPSKEKEVINNWLESEK